MKMRILVIAMIVFALAVVGTADAQQPINYTSKIVAIDSNEPTESGKHLCLDSAETMSACRSFIKGFLKGALLTDTAIIKSIEVVEPTYAERAIRTRFGKRPSSPTELACFC